MTTEEKLAALVDYVKTVRSYARTLSTIPEPHTQMIANGLVETATYVLGQTGTE